MPKLAPKKAVAGVGGGRGKGTSGRHQGTRWKAKSGSGECRQVAVGSRGRTGARLGNLAWDQSLRARGKNVIGVRTARQRAGRAEGLPERREGPQPWDREWVGRPVLGGGSGPSAARSPAAAGPVARHRPAAGRGLPRRTTRGLTPALGCSTPVAARARRTPSAARAPRRPKTESGPA